MSAEEKIDAIIDSVSGSQTTNPTTDASGSLQPIQLYTAATMNGWKGSIILEELGLPYEVTHLDFSKNQQKEEWYLKINPNGRIPSIIDPNNDNFAVTESANIMMYLCERYEDENKLNRLYPKLNQLKLRYQINQWLFFQMSGIGPIMGNAMYFYRIVRAKGIESEFAETRFRNESIRLISVLENRLSQQKEENNSDYLIGNHCTIADLCNYTYVKSSYWAHVDLKENGFNNVLNWLSVLDKRPAVIKGLTVPKENRKFFGEGSEEDIQKAIEENAAKFKVDHKGDQV